MQSLPKNPPAASSPNWTVKSYKRSPTFARELAVMLPGTLIPADDTFDVLIFDVLLAPILGVHALRSGRGALLERQELLLINRRMLRDGEAAGVVLRSGSGRRRRR